MLDKRLKNSLKALRVERSRRWPNKKDFLEQERPSLPHGHLSMRIFVKSANLNFGFDSLAVYEVGQISICPDLI